MNKEINRTHLAAAICTYFTEEKKYSPGKLAGEINCDRKQIAKWCDQETRIQQKSYTNIIDFVDHKTAARLGGRELSDSLCSYVIRYLAESGFDKTAVESVLNDHYGVPLGRRLDLLLTEYKPQEQVNLLHELRPNAIISRLCARMAANADYYEISDQDVDTSKFDRYLERRFDPCDSSILSERNYLILTFPDRYRVLLLIVPEVKNEDVTPQEFFDSIKEFMDDNGFGMIIFFTDQDKHNISYKTQYSLLKQCNVFFEYISEKDIDNAVIPGLTLREAMGSKIMLNTWIYAEIVMERMGTYYSIIRNEVLFAHKYPGYDQQPDNYESFENFLNTAFLKNVFHYAYFARHSIYFERTLVRKKAKDLIDKRISIYKEELKDTPMEQSRPEPDKKLDLVIELCAPNSFVSASLTNYAKKIMLFTSSKKAHARIHDEFNKAKEGFYNAYREAPKRRFPDNIELHLNHPNPEFITNSSNVLQHSADMIIIGFGMGSNLADLKEYLRWINLWLKDDGIVFISFLNADSILLKKSNVNLRSLERKPLAGSPFWHYETVPGLSFPIRTKCYSAAQAKRDLASFVEKQSYSSYPYLLALTDHIRNPEVRETIRLQDKHYALSVGPKKNIYEGHYLHVVGTKNSNANSKSRREQRNRAILDYLNAQNLNYDLYSHKDTVDTGNLYKTLLEENGLDAGSFQLLKLVILMAKGNSSTFTNKELVYCILPRDKEVVYNPEKFVPFNEKAIIRYLGHGTVTPFLSIPEITEDVAQALPEEAANSTDSNYAMFRNWRRRVCLIGIDQLPNEYVMVASGISTSSLRIRKEDFLSFFRRLDIKLIGPEMLQ